MPLSSYIDHSWCQLYTWCYMIRMLIWTQAIFEEPMKRQQTSWEVDMVYFIFVAMNSRRLVADPDIRLRGAHHVVDPHIPMGVSYVNFFIGGGQSLWPNWIEGMAGSPLDRPLEQTDSKEAGRNTLILLAKMVLHFEAAAFLAGSPSWPAEHEGFRCSSELLDWPTDNIIKQQFHFS